GHGEEVTAPFENVKATVQLTQHDGEERTVPAQGKRLALRPDEPGVYQIQTDEGAVAFAANVLYREESDLRKAATGRFGDWIDELALRLEYQNVSWVALLLVLALLALHGWLVARNRRSGACPFSTPSGCPSSSRWSRRSGGGACRRASSRSCDSSVSCWSCLRSRVFAWSCRAGRARWSWSR